MVTFGSLPWLIVARWDLTFTWSTLAWAVAVNNKHEQTTPQEGPTMVQSTGSWSSRRGPLHTFDLERQLATDIAVRAA